VRQFGDVVVGIRSSLLHHVRMMPRRIRLLTEAAPRLGRCRRRCCQRESGRRCASSIEGGQRGRKGKRGPRPAHVRVAVSTPVAPRRQRVLVAAAALPRARPAAGGGPIDPHLPASEELRRVVAVAARGRGAWRTLLSCRAPPRRRRRHWVDRGVATACPRAHRGHWSGPSPPPPLTRYHPPAPAPRAVAAMRPIQRVIDGVTAAAVTLTATASRTRWWVGGPRRLPGGAAARRAGWSPRRICNHPSRCRRSSACAAAPRSLAAPN